MEEKEVEVADKVGTDIEKEVEMCMCTPRGIKKNE